MTYKKTIKEELIEKEIYKFNIENTEHEYFEKGYYIVDEVISYLITGEPIKNQSAGTTDFGNIFGKTRATVNNWLKSGKAIYLYNGYYNKKGLISYLLK